MWFKACWSATHPGNTAACDCATSACAEGIFIKIHSSLLRLSVFKSKENKARAGLWRCKAISFSALTAAIALVCPEVRGCSWWESLCCSEREKATAKWQRVGNLQKRLSWTGGRASGWFLFSLNQPLPWRVPRGGQQQWAHLCWWLVCYGANVWNELFSPMWGIFSCSLPTFPFCPPVAVSPRAPKPSSTRGFLLEPIQPSEEDGTPSSVGAFLDHHDLLGQGDRWWAAPTVHLCLPLHMLLCSALLILGAQRFTASAATGSLIKQMIGKYCNYMFLFLAGGNAFFPSVHSLKTSNLGGFWVVLTPTTASLARSCA